MNEQEFKARYESDLTIYGAWGEFVNDHVVKGLSTKLGVERVDLFLKIPPKPRVKELKSIISKAFYRNKNYSNPYEEITDKVGVRYVVLLREEIGIVSDIVEHNPHWTASKDRDFEEEKERNPLIFDYQSVHYVVRSKGDISFNGISLPNNTPCEIQIRTLLQHAYSELTHDTIYKPRTRATPNVMRSIAKSMALIETTDDIFGEVNMTLSRENDQINAFLRSLTALYQNIAIPDYEEKINVFILDAYKELLSTIEISDVEKYVFENSFIKDVIARKSGIAFLYKQPIVLLLFYLISQQRSNCKRLWPLTESDIRPLYVDLGIAFDCGC